MGLFDRLFGRKKQEPPIEEVVKEALENIGELEEETAPVPEAGENLEAEAVQPYQDEQQLDDQISDTKDSLADVEEQLVTEELASQAIQEESKEPEHEKEIIAENQEVAQGATQTEETLEEHQSESSDETVEELVEQADLSDEASSHTEHEAASYDEVATDSNNEIEPATEAVPLTESEQVNQEADIAEESEAAATEEPAELPQEESTQEKYDRSLKKTRTGFGARLNAFFANFRSVDEEFFEDLEELLITSDVGVQVASSLTEELRYEARLENAKKPAALRQLIIEKLVDIYEKDGHFNEKINFQNGLTVMLFVGVNGVGKTTSIGKLAYKYKQQGKKVMLVAADTFRAGAVAQLAEWGRRVGVPVVTGPEKSDPASVVYDGMERAQAEQVDVLMIDTAGRLQNKDNLMAELEKIGRIIKRVDPEAPHETFLALDASTGQNALVQAKEFSKITPVTGIVLTKIDGTARGGVVLAIRQELDIPVKLIGFGEKIDDIGEFNSENFMKGLLEGLV
ncbi:signal recognition particle-docking protein FtsY [Streptococcus sanguinis]|uniref:Signal recognition particle receptor FtsY n=1 Tax=Streptococcus sanguinis TaxID=1305 RepID=A0A7H8V6F0_STRSA|nr:signal recognition particle-docking protein FtsY [Streptococcus sanguinis]